MAYIGREPQVGNFQVCDAISVVNGQAAYTMQVSSVNVSPETANHMLVSLNGVLQAPGSSYTVSGSTITFASNLVTGDVINFIHILGSVLDLGVPSDSTVSLAKLTATGTKDATTFLRGDNTFAGAGITEADNWRISSTQSISADTDTVVNSSWERNDNNSDKIGTGLTESSGVFTFPSTGIYLISYQQNIARTGDSRYFTGSIELSTDSGSNYSLVARSYTHIKQTSSETSANSSTSCTIDVTNASTFRFRLQAGGDETFTLRASSSYQITGFYCLRLGDT